MKPDTPVTVALVLLPGDPDAAKKALQFIPKAALVKRETCQLGDLQHADTREIIGAGLTAAAGRDIDQGAWPGPAEPAKQAVKPAA